MRFLQSHTKLLFEPGRDGIPATGKSPDHYPVGWIEVPDHRSGDMPEPSGHPVPLHRPAHGLRDHEPYPGPTVIKALAPACVHHDVGLHRPHPSIDCGTEFRRPRHPVARRKHRADPASYYAVSLRRPLPRRLATIARPARVRIRSRNPCTRARRRLLGWKVRLPLATAVTPCCVWQPHRAQGRDAIAVGKLFVSLANRRGLRRNLRIAAVSPRSGDCSRVLTRFLKVKPTTAAAAKASSATPVTAPALPKIC
jgi:hypothetical protein